MTIDKNQLRELITDVLIDCDPVIPYSDNAVELLMLTCAQESHLGTYLRQIGLQNGGGYGIMQMEIRTHNDMWDQDLFKINDNFISYKPHLEELVDKYYNSDISLSMNLIGNIPYQILMARLVYYRVKEPLPSFYTTYKMAAYYKKYYNTYKGKATIKEAIKNYERLCF